MKKLHIKPLGDRVLVKPAEKGGEKKLASGIIIPDSADKQESIKGEVVGMGPGEYKDGKLVPMQVKAGDTVLFNEYSGNKIKIEGEEYYLVPEASILAVIK